MARRVDGPEITGQVVHKQTGQSYGGVTVTVSPKVYTDPEMTASVTSLTADGTGVFSCYAPPGVYTFTTTAVDAQTLEPVEVLGREGGTGVSSAASGLPQTFVTKTANYTAAVGEFVQANALSGGFNVTLPSNPVAGALVAVKKTDTSGNSVTVLPAGAGTIDGDANAIITTKNFGGVFEHTGSDVWKIAAVTASGGGTTLPSQTGNSGKFLTTDGTTLSWGSTGGSIPSQTGNAGGTLTTDGSTASWTVGGAPSTIEWPINNATQFTIPSGANNAIYHRVLLGSRSPISKLDLWVVTASGNIALAIFRDNGADAPGALVMTTGSIACPGPGIVTVALGASYIVGPGDWFALVADNTLAKFSGAQIAGGNYPTWRTVTKNLGSLTFAANPTSLVADVRVCALTGHV